MGRIEMGDDSGGSAKGRRGEGGEGAGKKGGEGREGEGGGEREEQEKTRRKIKPDGKAVDRTETGDHSRGDKRPGYGRPPPPGRRVRTCVPHLFYG